MTSKFIGIGPSVAVQAVSCSRVTQWPLNSLIFSLSFFLSELITQHVVVVVNFIQIFPP